MRLPRGATLVHHPTVTLLQSRSRCTVVIATRNRKETLLRTLAHMTQAQERPHITVVDNDSSDGTAGTVVALYPEVRVFVLSENHGGAARNVGLMAAQTPYVALCDDDSWFESGSLQRAMEVMDRHLSLGLVAGRILVGEEDADDPSNRIMELSPIPARRTGDPDLPGSPIRGFLSTSAVGRRGAFVEAGGFHELLYSGAEESLLAADMVSRGWELRYLPDVIVHHRPLQQAPPEQKRSQAIRDELLLAWMRRRSSSAIKITGGYLRRALEDPVVREGLRAALVDAGKAIRERRPVAPELERELRML